MSATRTFTAITGSGSGGAYAAGDRHGYQTEEKIRQALDLLAYNAGPYHLGGDKDGIQSASYTPVNGYLPHTINGDSLGGMTVDLVVVYRTADAATSVTVRLRNTTDSSTAATGTTSTATTDTEETISATLASGAKSYRLEVTGSNATNPVYARGYLRIRKVPA